MRILGIETSGQGAGIALLDGDTVTASGEISARGKTGEKLADLVRALLGLAERGLRDLDRICVDVGPGSFTGIRVGLALAKGLSLGAGVPLAAISSLEALAAQSPAAGLCLASLRAPRGMFYGGFFSIDAPGPEVVVEDACWTLDGLWDALRRREELRRGARIHVLGPAGEELSRQLEALCAPDGAQLVFLPGLRPTAEWVARLGGSRQVLSAGEIASLVPRYLRGADVREPKTGTPTQTAS
jgi:tRNA threonylcarbamoyladenosine biosynthesis protein TsaB